MPGTKQLLEKKKASSKVQVCWGQQWREWKWATAVPSEDQQWLPIRQWWKYGEHTSEVKTQFSCKKVSFLKHHAKTHIIYRPALFLECWSYCSFG